MVRESQNRQRFPFSNRMKVTNIGGHEIVKESSHR